MASNHCRSQSECTRTDIVFVGWLRDKLTECAPPRQRSGILIGGAAASLEFNHRAMSLKSIREERNDHFEIHRDRSLAQMRRGHDVHNQHQREKAADCDN
jgi:hypothetical protein